MISSKSLRKYSLQQLSRSFSSKTQISLNCVIRDHDQSAYANNMNSTLDPRYFQVVQLWNQGNKAGDDKFFGHFETGGQEPGKTAMNCRDSGKLYATLHKYAPDTWLRSLSRSCYGNAVFPLHPNDLKKWYSYVHNSGKKVIFKVFDYNTNFEEMDVALRTIHEIGAPIELAVPHSPDPLYFDFFAKKIEAAALVAKKFGATISCKRMVNGLTEAEGQKIGSILAPLAMKHGIHDITLHAHGDVPNAIAAFLHECSQHGIKNARGDIVHAGSGGTFPNYYDVANKLAQLGTKINPSQGQLDILKEIDRIQQERDKRFLCVRVGGAFTVADKVAMGMPDGGESYTVEAIIKAGLSKKYRITEPKTQDIFQEYYKEFRERFGMVVSVTPGHKRIEEGAITSMLNTIDWLKELAAENEVSLKDIDPKVVRAALKKLDYQTLYAGLNPKTVDAFRNNELPLKLSHEAIEYLCKAHMTEMLTNKEFDGLEQEFKDNLILVATETEQVAELVDQLVGYGKIPDFAAKREHEDYHPLSLVQASGIRKYMEGVGAKETGPKYREVLEGLEKGGLPVSKTFGSMDAAEAMTIICGTHSYIETACKHGPFPTPEGLTIQEFNKQFANFKKKLTGPATLDKWNETFNAAEKSYAEKNGPVKPYPSIKYSNEEVTKLIAEHDRKLEVIKLVD